MTHCWPVVEDLGLILVFLGDRSPPPPPTGAAPDEYSWITARPVSMETDWQAMVAAVKDAVELMPGWAPGVKKTWMAECQEFMRWLIDDNFVLLGVRDYAVRGKGDKATLNVVGGSGLGILRGDSDTRRSRPVADLAPEARRLSQKRPLIVTKTNARSTVHRAGFMDYIGVLRIDDEGRTVGERRIIGLFTSRAYNQNAMKTPMLRVRTRNILDRADLLEGSHAWRTMVHILESLPRDELFQATTRQLRRLAEGVLDLQERKLVRLFIRKERYGRFYSCLAYIPREQFNTENRETVQTSRASPGCRCWCGRERGPRSSSTWRRLSAKSPPPCAHGVTNCAPSW